MEVVSIEVGTLLIAFHIKQILISNPLQNRYSSSSPRKDWKAIASLPIFSLLHAVTTLVITALCTKQIELSLKIALVDFLIHMLTGIIKVWLDYRILTDYERLKYKKRIEQALADEAIYDCFQAETRLMERERENGKFWMMLRLTHAIHFFSYYSFIYTILLYLQ